ncbi:MAG: CotH kinase family protein [Clostridiales bacterium]|nr:CotH kinase family protein [Clostridiales bacterium]
MRGKVKWLIRIALTGILFLLFFGRAYALSQRALYAGCPSRCGARVTARWKDNTMVLSLPGCWDLTQITLEMERTEVLLLGKEQIRAVPGEPVDLSGIKDQTVVVRNEQGQDRGYLLIMQGSEIPALFLEVDRKQLSDVNSSKKHRITEGRAVYEEADGSVSFDGALEQLRCRGNNTFLYSKKPYQLKLAEKASLSGMGKGKTWVLLANWVDVSLLRNQIMLDLSREAGLKNAAGCVQADVWINGIYNGLYLMTEKIQIGKGRIDITNLEKATEKVNPEPFDAGTLRQGRAEGVPLMRSYPSVADPEDITGGYIFTVEKYARLRDYQLPGFRTKKELSIRIKEPTCPSRGQAEYLAGRISEMQQAVMAADGINPTTGKTYGEYLDVTSFAQKLLIEDFCKNYDLAGGSQFMYKDSDLVDPLIYAGPAWDYDLSFGNMKDRGVTTDTPYVTTYRRNANLYWLLYQHEAFRELTGLIWQRDFRPLAEVLLGTREAKPGGIVRSLDGYKERISASAQMNAKRWGVSDKATKKEAGVNFDRAVEYLRTWITERTAWMNGYYTTEQVTDAD